VAMSMAILAAVLAGATMHSHRAHNETLKLHIEANDDITMASDEWGHYQAKKNRQYMYEASAEALAVTARDSKNPDADSQAAKCIAGWRAKAAEYKRDSDGIQNKALEYGESAKEKQHEAESFHHRANRLDYGHLGLELALVVCSIAVLTKLRSFWLAGIVIGVIGAGVSATSFFMH